MYEQRNWIAYKDKACQFYKQNLIPNIDNRHFYEACISKITDDRTRNFIDYCQFSGCYIPQKPPQFYYDGNWAIGCDQQFLCTAIGAKRIGPYDSKLHYIRIRWQAGQKAPPSIRIFASIFTARDDVFYPQFSIGGSAITEKNMTWNTYRDEIGDVPSSQSSVFLTTLLTSKNISIWSSGQEDKKATIDLSTFKKQYHEIENYVSSLYPDTFPGLPIIHVVKDLKQDDIPSTTVSIDDFGEICPNSELTASNGDKYVLMCQSEYKTDTEYTLHRLSQNGKQILNPSAFDGKASVDILNNPEIENRILKTNFSIYAYSDLGAKMTFAFDGHEFRLIEYKYGPTTPLLDEEDWPVIYRAKIIEAP